MSLPFTSPHQRAGRLVEARLDAARGDAPPLTEADHRWLDRHLARCRRCRREAEARLSRSALLESAEAIRAPEGFAARAVEAARRVAAGAASPRSLSPGERGSSERPDPASAGGWRPWSWGAWTVAGGAAVAVLFAAGLALRAPPGQLVGAGEVAVGGAAHLEDEAPHFVIRAPGTGAARLRTVATAIVEAHRGQVTATPGAVSALIPRSELMDTMAELERRGGFRVELRREPSEHEAKVSLRFVLD